MGTELFSKTKARRGVADLFETVRTSLSARSFIPNFLRSVWVKHKNILVVDERLLCYNSRVAIQKG